MKATNSAWLMCAAIFLAAGCDRSRDEKAEAAVKVDAKGGTGGATFEVFADGYQVYVYDSRTEPVFISEWNKQSIADKLVAKPGAIAFCPMREMNVPVSVKVQADPPAKDLSAWDHVSECSLDVPSGRILIMGPTDAPVAQIDVKPGTYRVRVGSSGLGTISANGVDGKDQYELCFWPALSAPPSVLKRWKDRSTPTDAP